MLTLLEDLTSICHYCLVDNEPISSGVSMTPRQPTNTGKTTRFSESEDASSSIFSNLVHVFSSQGVPNKTATSEEGALILFLTISYFICATRLEILFVYTWLHSFVVAVDKPIVEAREGLLSILPAILSSLVTVWHAWSTNDIQKSRWRVANQVPLAIGNTKVIGICNNSYDVTSLHIITWFIVANLVIFLLFSLFFFCRIFGNLFCSFWHL